MIASDLTETDALERCKHSPIANSQGVNRTCTEIRPDGSRADSAHRRPLSDFRDRPAYVLLGEPGAGKTHEFTRESDELGDTAVKVSARSFVALDPRRPEWQNKTLFIDGLDEMRAGLADARPPLDEIRNRLDRLRPPRFRLSCREADWLGNNDLQALREVSPNSQITVLRLDPLSAPAARELLTTEYPALDTESFVQQALQRGIHSMLRNPLTLFLLAEAATPSGHLPGSRLETFETACRGMVTEHNKEHQLAGGDHPDRDLLDAAGHLCVLLLLSGIETCSPRPVGELSTCLSLRNVGEIVDGPTYDAMSAAVSTKLFRVGADEMVFVPRHRQVAEFLAGRYLARRIGKGLPASRVSALMTGLSDGRGVVTVLRGLSAWLAAHSPEARCLLVDMDPVGVALFGDINGFTANDKEHLLRALARLTPEEPVLDYEQPDSGDDAYWTDSAWAFRHLASADMVEPIRTILARGQSGGADERLELLVLGALSRAEELEIGFLGDLLPDLIARIRDDSQPLALRRSALDAYLHILPEDARDTTLLALLDELHEDADSDADGELRGTLLRALYPDPIDPSQIWRYALGRLRRHYYVRASRFDEFWNHILPTQSSKHQIAELLDALSDNGRDRILELEETSFADVPMKVLARGLRVFGDGLDVPRLYRWLSVTGPYFWHADRADESTRAVREWLIAHPLLQQALYLEWLERRIKNDPAEARAWWFFDHPHQTTLPADFGLWCLEKAIEIGDSDPALARGLLGRSFRSLEDPSMNQGLTLEGARAQTREHRELARHLEKLCQEHTESKDAALQAVPRHIRERQEEQREQEQQRQQQWAEHLRAHETELRENRFAPPDLHNLATEYLGLFSDSDPRFTPRRRLSDFLGGDELAVDAALAGLRDAVRREDVPDVDETIALWSESQQSWLAYPVLASLNLLETEEPGSLDSLDDTAMRKALAIHYCVALGEPHPTGVRLVWTDSWAGDNPRGEDQPRNWHDRWVDEDPELVLDVLYQCAVAGIRSGEDSPPGLNELAAITSHDRAVQNIWLKLLKVFPTRGASARLPLLDRLLTKALQYPDRTALEELVEHKLTLTSTVDGQRVRWLAVGVAISPTRGLTRLQAFVDGNETRTRHLAEVLRHPVEHVRRSPDHPGSIRSTLASSRDPAALKSLIEMLGQFFGPMAWGGYVTLEAAMSAHLLNLIGRLGSLAGEDASRAFEDLIKDSRVASWHGHLKMANQRRLVANRDSSYQHPTVEEIQRTLAGGAPANAADLAALLREHLTGIRADIRGGNGELWRHFWNEKSHGQPDTRKSENSCRDALLTVLRPRLPSGVRAESEYRHAGETRADIEVICGEFNVPIEVKPNDSPHMWSALHSQLIGKYTSLPETSGCGIYLVLWFGADETKRDSDGSRPATPEELEQQLANTLTPDEARKVSVLVVDVTKPGVTVRRKLEPEISAGGI